MIYEVVTYDLKPRTVPQAELRFAAAYAERKRYSELVASWHTEFGPLNQIVQIWPYRDLAQREEVGAAVTAAGCWPPDLSDVLVRRRTELMAPVHFSPLLAAGSFGPFYEWRTYHIPPGTLDTMMGAWERAMPLRLAFGPVLAVWTTVIGSQELLTHIWPYRSLEQRQLIREQLRASGQWPPFLMDEAAGGPGYDVLHQENKLFVPATFSPLN